MQKVVVDAGPLIALFNSRDRYHQVVLDFVRDFNSHFISNHAVVTEVTHLLDFSVNTQLNFLKWIQKGGIHIQAILDEDLDRIITLTAKYRDRPMDFADASLVALSERMGIRDIATLDQDFYVYRLRNRKTLHNVLAPLL